MIVFGWLFLVSSGFCFYFLLKHYHLHHHHLFRWQNQFPYELSQTRYFQVASFLIWIVILLTSFTVGYVSQLVLTLYLPQYQWIGFLFVFWVISASLLFWVRPTNTRWFLIFHLVPMIVLIILFFYSTYSFYTGPFQQFQTFFPYSSLLQGLFQSLLILNPKLKQWYQLEQVEEANKKPRFQRPMWFVLAYTTWLSMLNGLVWLLLLQFEILIG